MMSALHPYGLQDKAYLAVAVIAFANFAFGLLYMFSLGPFNEGGGSYTGSMRYLRRTLGLVVPAGLEEARNGVQFMQDEDAGIVKWGKRHLSRLEWLWKFYSGKSGIGRFVQTSFPFYGGGGPPFPAAFSPRLSVFFRVSG